MIVISPNNPTIAELASPANVADSRYEILVWDTTTGRYFTRPASDLLFMSADEVTSLQYDDRMLLRRSNIPYQFDAKHLGISQQTNYTADETLLGTANRGHGTNLGASATVTLTLWSASPGNTYSVQRLANHALRLNPAGAEVIGEGGAGKYLELQTLGGIDLVCYEVGKWAIVSGSCLIGYEP